MPLYSLSFSFSSFPTSHLHTFPPPPIPPSHSPSRLILHSAATTTFFTIFFSHLPSQFVIVTIGPMGQVTRYDLGCPIPSYFSLSIPLSYASLTRLSTSPYITSPAM